MNREIDVWKCGICGDVLISRSYERHQMDYCRCGSSAVDLEENYGRFLGEVQILGVIELNNTDYFAELVIGTNLQGFNKDLGIRYINLNTYLFLKKLEREIILEKYDRGRL